MVFYINEVYLPESDWNHQCIGLFDSNNWEGSGNFCGWYARECYINTRLLAYGIQLKPGNKLYDPKYPFDGGFCENHNKYYERITIGSCYWERKLEADSIEEAIEMFKNQTWN